MEDDTKFTMDCKKATYLISKKQEGGNLTSKEKLGLQFHKMMCKVCSLFKKETDLLNIGIENLQKEENSQIEFSDDFKSILKDRLYRSTKQTACISVSCSFFCNFL